MELSRVAREASVHFLIRPELHAALAYGTTLEILMELPAPAVVVARDNRGQAVNPERHG